MPPHDTPRQPSYYLPATAAVVVVVEGQALSCQSLLDLAAVSRPSPRPDWSDLLVECANIQRHMAVERWAGMGAAIGVLVTLMGVTVTDAELVELIEYALSRAHRDGPQIGFSSMAHHLCVLAVQ